MRRQLINTLLKVLIIPSIIFTLLVFTYSSYLKTLPISYSDEVRWIILSQFFQFYIHGDFQSKIWQTQRSYNQPKLAEFAYGSWLYPLYLTEKKQNEKSFDYSRFLIKNGFYETTEFNMKNYSEDIKNSNTPRFDTRDVGLPEYYIRQYGLTSLKPIDIIYYARIMNIFLLTGAVILAYFLVLQFAGVPTALLFSFFYGLNFLIINTGLKAHSEALFVFTFNAAFLFMTLYFKKGNKILNLLLFSLFAGLCMSTKLNGSMLIAIFIIIYIVFFLLLKKHNIVLLSQVILSVLLILIVFVSLNPFTLPDPVKKTHYMFQYRMDTASYQQTTFQTQSLKDGFSRIKKIFENFYFSEKTSYFNGVKIFEDLSASKIYQTCLMVLFSLGLFYSIKLALNKNRVAIILVCSFIGIIAIMSYYLLLDKDRYYAHLPLFFVIFQSLGLYILIKYSFKYTKLLVSKTNNNG